MTFLTESEIFEILDSIADDVLIFHKVRPHNGGEIRIGLTYLPILEP